MGQGQQAKKTGQYMVLLFVPAKLQTKCESRKKQDPSIFLVTYLQELNIKIW
jgi:hypothetical protein